MVVAKKGSFRCEHRLDDVHDRVSGRGGAGPGNQRRNRFVPGRSSDWPEPRFDEVALGGIERNGTVIQDQSANEIEILVGHRPALTRRTISGPTRLSGNTRSASPARATEPGMPQTTDVASSCVRICAPASRTASQPR